ncbi:protein kinase [bacterium]|nr:protein kinase [bacterium]
MVTGDGSTSTREPGLAAELNAALPETNSVEPLPSAMRDGSSHSASHAQVPRLASSETVINSGTPSTPLSAGPEAGGESASIMRRLFPSPNEAGSTYSSLSPAGIELDHFRIEERIGFGGMGAVFRAVDTRLQRHVALKLLSPSQSYDDASIKRFQNEARAAARLDHENVARVFYIGEENGLHFIAFEYVTGSNVRDMIRTDGRLSPSDAVNYALQIAYALKHTAAMGVVHRDIKPSNVIITPTGRAKLVDLGLARKDNTESQGDLTLPGTTLGTFDYISPEQAKDPRSVDVRSDIYSLGCTIYHMLTGQPPYPEGTVLQKLLDHQGKEAPDPAAINPRVSEQLSAVVRKMMNSDRNRRYQTPELLIRDLSYVAATLGLRGVNPEGLVWVASKAVEPGGLSRHAGWIATVAILFGVVGLLSAFPQLGSHSSRHDSVDGPIVAREDGAETGVAGSESTETGNAVAALGSGASSNSVETEGSGTTTGADVTRSEMAPGAPTTAEIAQGSNKPNGTVDSTNDAAPKGTPSAGSDTASSITKTASPGERTTAEPVTPRPANTVVRSADSGASTTGSSSRPGVSSAGKSTPGVAATSVANADAEYPVTLFSSDSQEEESYRTLESACAAAADGSTIELRFNGTLSERSFRIARKNITIRAARGFRPVIEFAPTDLDSTDAAVRMVSVVGSPLHIINVEFRLLIPDDAAADSYALFGVTRNETLQLEQVTASIINPTHRPAALIEIAADPAQMPPDPTTMPTTNVRSTALVDLRNCFVRGEATLARLAVTGRLEMTVENSAAALDGLFHVLPPGSPVTERPSLSLSLDHVSALLHGSLMRISGPVSVDGPTIELQPRNCILTASPDTPLVTTDADVPADEIRRMLVWRGQRNFYDRLETYLSIAAAEEIYGFEEWRQYWGSSLEVGPWSGTLSWSEATRPAGVLDDHFSSLPLTAFQLALSSSGENPAIDGATDGNDAGVDLSMLVSPWQPKPAADARRNEVSAADSVSGSESSDGSSE